MLIDESPTAPSAVFSPQTAQKEIISTSGLVVLPAISNRSKSSGKESFVLLDLQGPQHHSSCGEDLLSSACSCRRLGNLNPSAISFQTAPERRSPLVLNLRGPHHFFFPRTLFFFFSFRKLNLYRQYPFKERRKGV